MFLHIREVGPDWVPQSSVYKSISMPLGPKPCYIVIMCKFTSIKSLKLELVPNDAFDPSLVGKLSL